MAIEIKLGDRIAQVELLSEDGDRVRILVDNKEYDLDVKEVENGVFSVLYRRQSYNVELIAKDNPKEYAVNTFYHSYDAEIIDAESRYLKSRNANNLENSENTISAPMPGKIVKIMTSVGSEVKKGDTLIIISAMKMESEYKAMKDGVVSDIYVKEDSTIDSNQALIRIE